MKEPYGEGLGAAMLAAVPVGERPAGGTCPVATVVISGGGKGDRPVESPEVKAPLAGRKTRSDPSRGASNLTGRSNGESISPEIRALLEADGRIVGRAEPFRSWRRPMSESLNWRNTILIFPGT